MAAPHRVTEIHRKAGIDLSEAYTQPIERVLEVLHSDPEQGLTTEEAHERLEAYGPNELRAEKQVPAWRKFLAQFQDALILLLLAAAAISLVVWLYEKSEPLPYEALVIFAIVLLNGILGYVQEARAERAVAALRAMSAAEATVLRHAQPRRIPAAQVVPGDIILIEEGDTIPADARLIRTVALQTAEASLTGESLPVTKETAPLDEPASVGDRTNMVFAGTAATYGRGRAVVTATGMQTEMGNIAGLLHTTKEEQTPLQQELDRTGKAMGLLVIVIAAAMVITIILVEGVRDFNALVDVMILAVALAVAAVPEGLPAVVTTVLALGVQRMARRNAIVRKLPAVETLGSATVIASDKTGTLTRNEMTVRAIVTFSGRADVTGTGYGPTGELQVEGHALAEGPQQTEIVRTLSAARSANNAVLQEQNGQWAVQGDPTEGALIAAAHRAGLTGEELRRRFERVGEVPFSSERKLMSTIHTDVQRPERLVLFSKGAPDILLSRCREVLVGSEPQALTPEESERIRAANEQLAGEALRTLGTAYRPLPREALDDLRDLDTPEAHGVSDRLEEGLIFLGLVGMIDPPRDEVKPAVDVARQAGIRPIMITGDHPRTAAAIAGELGIARPEGPTATATATATATVRALTGPELDRLSDEELQRAVRECSVYARVNPGHKLRIVRALQANGEVVAMTGDGVNDAPALKTADIGVAMGITGTDVSKEAADMVLADDNFATIVSAVEEGRTVFANIRKFLRFLLSSNMGEVLTMFGGVVLAGVLGTRTGAAGEGVVAPLLATQILWTNLVTDGAPALALGLDPAERGVMKQPPRPRGSGVITGQMWRGIALVGVIVAVGTLLVLDASLPGGFIAGTGSAEYARTMAFTTLILFQMFNVFNARSDTESALPGIFRNGWLWGSVALSVALQVAVTYVPFLQQAFGTVALGWGDWLFCTIVGSSVLWLRELSKLPHRLGHSSPAWGEHAG